MHDCPFSYPTQRLKVIICCGRIGISIVILHSGNLTWLAGKWTRIEDVFPIRNGDIPACYVSLTEGKHDITGVFQNYLLKIRWVGFGGRNKSQPTVSVDSGDATPHRGVVES